MREWSEGKGVCWTSYATVRVFAVVDAELYLGKCQLVMLGMVFDFTDQVSAGYVHAKQRAKELWRCGVGCEERGKAAVVCARKLTEPLFMAWCCNKPWLVCMFGRIPPQPAFCTAEKRKGLLASS